MGLENKQAQRHGVYPFIQQCLDGGEVPQGLGHLGLIHVDHAVVQPDVGQGTTRRRFRLGDLVLVVGKDQVRPTQMQINGVPKRLMDHGGTLDMPTGPPRPPWGRIAGLTGPGPFPQGKVGGMMLSVRVIRRQTTTGPFLLLLEISPTQLPVLAGFHYGKIHVPIGGIGRPLGLQSGDHGLNLTKATGGPGVVVSPQDVEGIHFRKEAGNVPLGDSLHAAAFGLGPSDNFVVNVGKILNKPHDKALPTQVAAQEIPNDIAAGMAKMTGVIHRDPTAIDGDSGWLTRGKHLLATGEGVVEPKNHWRAMESPSR